MPPIFILKENSRSLGQMQQMENDKAHKRKQHRNNIMQKDISNEVQKAANAELKAINEALRTTAKELELSKEELTTKNLELKEKIEEANRTNSDLVNLIHATDIATIFLDLDLKIKRFTPRTTEIYNLIPGDIGRPLSHITHTLSAEHFEKDAAQVLENLHSHDREVRSNAGRFYIAHFSPYKNLEEKIEGVVLSFFDVTERKLSENLIQKERAFAEAIIATVRQPLIVLNKDLKIISANQSFYKIFKVTPEETVQKIIYDLGNKQWNIPKLKELLENILPQKKAFENFEVEHNFEKIGPCVMLLNAQEIISADKNDRMILLSIEDFTKRKNIENALIANEKKYKTLFNSIDQGFCIIEVIFDEHEQVIDYRYLETNNSFLNQTGLKNAIGKTMKELVPEHEQFWFNMYGKIALTGQSQSFEHAAEALRRYYDVYAFRVDKPQEKKVAVLFNDITTRRQQEEALRNSEEDYRVIVNQAVAGIIRIDLAENIIFCNTQFAIMLGYSHDELFHKKLSELVHDDDKSHHFQLLETLKKDHQGFVIEKRLKCKDGSFLWVNNYNAPIYSGKGNLQSIAIISVDISSQKAIEKQKNDFIMVASHELKTPLTSIKAYGELLQEIFDKNGDSNSGLITKLNKQITRMIKLVYELLDTSRIAEGKLLLSPEIVDMNDLIIECIEEVRLTPAGKQIIVRADDVPLVFVDKERICQVITNFISNAQKHSPHNKNILISCENIKDAVLVKVRDFGNGIKKEFQEKVFKKFFQVNKQSSSPSLGLGLYISREIIKRHGGEIGVISPPDSEGGSEFYFTIPLKNNGLQ